MRRDLLRITEPPFVQLGLVLLGLASALLALHCTGEAPPSARHAVLVSIDTLRADHLGCYGSERDTSPSLDAFRQDAVLFENAFAHSPSTLASHASMLTSRLPQHHGASFDDRTAISVEVPTLTEILKRQGFATAAFHNAGQVDASFGMGRGFDVYDRPNTDAFWGSVDGGIRWLREERNPDERFFLFLHTYEVHHPYTPKREIVEAFGEAYEGRLPRDIPVRLLERINADSRSLTPEDLAHIERSYDGEIRAMDESFGKLMAALQETGLYDETLIVFTSDHGEEFGEHGRVGWHGHTLYDELLRVPLVVKFAHGRHAQASVPDVVRSIDIAPTLLAGLGLPPEAAFHGVDQLQYLEEPRSGRNAPPVVSWIDAGRQAPFRESTSIRHNSWKLWRGALYNLKRDPLEQRDVAERFPDVVQRLERRLTNILAKHDAPKRTNAELDTATLEQLRALGYTE